MTISRSLPEDATMLNTYLGSFDLLQSRTNIHPITVESGQLHKLSFLAFPNTQQLIVRMTISDKPLEAPVDDYYKSISPNGMTIYLYDKNTEFPEPPAMLIQNRYAGAFYISPYQMAVEPGQYFINMKNLSNVKTGYSITIKH